MCDLLPARLVVCVGATSILPRCGNYYAKILRDVSCLPATTFENVRGLGGLTGFRTVGGHTVQVACKRKRLFGEYQHPQPMSQKRDMGHPLVEGEMWATRLPEMALSEEPPN